MDLTQYSMVWMGDTGVGKTTTLMNFLKSLYPDKQPLFLEFEDRFQNIPGIMAVKIDTMADLKSVIGQLRNPEFKKRFSCIVIDTLDKFEESCERYVLEKDDSELPDYFVTAQTLDYKNRIYMQSIWQSHIDASISSTVNVPNDFTIEQVESLYMSAWESGLKGVTIFRDGCKRSGILTTTSSVSDINDDKEKKTLPRGYIVVADDNVIGLKRKVMSGCGSLHIVAMFDPITGELLETYISKGSTGGCQSNLAAVSRLISLSARAGVDVYTIADQLKSCPACPSYVGRTMTKHDTSKGKCCPDAIANALIDMYKEMKNSIFSDDIEMSNVKSKVIKKNTEDKEQSVNVKNPCPVCGEELTFEGGCNVCKACGWSKCD